VPAPTADKPSKWMATTGKPLADMSSQSTPPRATEYLPPANPVGDLRQAARDRDIRLAVKSFEKLGAKIFPGISTAPFAYACAKLTGSQYRRRVSPASVPGPTRVIISFSFGSIFRSRTFRGATKIPP
jgi:hypothetical protein